MMDNYAYMGCLVLLYVDGELRAIDEGDNSTSNSKLSMRDDESMLNFELLARDD